MIHRLALNIGDSRQKIKNRLLIRQVKAIFTNATSRGRFSNWRV